MKICTSVLTLAFILTVSAPAFAKKPVCPKGSGEGGCINDDEKSQQIPQRNEGKPNDERNPTEDK